MNKLDLYRKLRPLQVVNYEKGDFERLSVLTYNLLAQHHIWNDIYPYCGAGVLKWPQRRSNLVAEFEAYGGTQIMAFQEVSKWKEFWEPTFCARKWPGGIEYNAFFAEKSDGRDGLAIVYNKHRFLELGREELSFAPLMSQLEATPNIAQILVLKDSLTGSTLIVSNTHLFWRPEFDSLRALQAHRLRARIDALIGEQNIENPTIIMCGDWNSDPKSIAYRLLTQATTISDQEWTTLIEDHAKCMPVMERPESSLENATRLLTRVRSDFDSTLPSLKSAYSLLRSREDPSRLGEPEHTSINSYVDCLDYIFYGGPGTEVELLLMLPPKEILFGQTALPNQVYSSDHVALWCQFMMKPKE